MRTLLRWACCLLPVLAQGATPVYEIDLDVQNTTKPFSIGYLYTYDKLEIRANTLQDGAVWTNSGYGGYFCYFLDGYGSTNYLAVSGVSATNYFSFTNGANTFYTNGNFLCMVVLTNATETKTWGHGTLKVQRNPATSGGSLSPIGGVVNWSLYSGYQNTSNSGPVRAGAGLTPTINADGSMTIAVDPAVTSSFALVTSMVAGDLAGSNHVAAATNAEAAARIAADLAGTNHVVAATNAATVQFIAGDLAGSNHVAAATNAATVQFIAGDLAGSNHVAAATNGATVQFIAGDLAGSNYVAAATNAVRVTATNEAIEVSRTYTDGATNTVRVTATNESVEWARNYVDSATNAVRMTATNEAVEAARSYTDSATNAVRITATNEAVEWSRSYTDGATNTVRITATNESIEWARTYTDGATNALRVIATNEAYNAATGVVVAATGGCVQVTGDTMTGLLTVPTFTSTGAVTLSTSGGQIMAGALSANMSTSSSSYANPRMILGHSLAGNTAYLTCSNASSSTAGAGLGLISDDGALMSANDRLGVLVYSGSVSNNGTLAGAAAIEAYAAQNWIFNSAYGGYLVFKTAKTNTITRVEVMRIISDGAVGINTNTPAAKLHVGGNLLVTGAVNMATAGGLVGVGTNTPTNRLHVDGDARFGGAADLFNINTNGHFTLQGNARQWRDLVGAAITIKIKGADDIVYDEWTNCVAFEDSCSTNITAIDDYVSRSYEFDHDYKTNTTIFPHIHFVQTSENQTNGMMFMRYRWNEKGSPFSDTWIDLGTASNQMAFASTGMVQIMEFPAIVPTTNHTLSSRVDLMLQRNGTWGNANTNLCVLEMDIHYEAESLGSDTRTNF